jgi:[ribosomal protein S5]-alanine N-acetyltransferase
MLEMEMKKVPQNRAQVFETHRLIVRTAAKDDVDLYYALWTNPEVMKNVGFPQGLRINRTEIKEQLSIQGESEFDQLLVIELKDSGQAIGECKLAQPNELGIAEPDVKLLPAYWGQGYGSECWRALIAYQFKHTDCQAIQTTPNVENIAAIRLYEAVGARRVGEDVGQFPDTMRDYTTPVHHYIYILNRADWQGNAIA